MKSRLDQRRDGRDTATATTTMARLEAGYLGSYGKDTDDVGAALDLGMEPFDRVGRMQLLAVLLGEMEWTPPTPDVGRREG